MLSEAAKYVQQDFVDNVINEMIIALSPSPDKLQWNVKVISEIREVLSHYFVDELHLCTVEDFYPYMDEEV